MGTEKQGLGKFGEAVVSKHCFCPKCKKGRFLKCLPSNFKCADVICDFCGFLAQVKTTSVSAIDVVPKRILGAAWAPQSERMEAGIYFPLFIVLASGRAFSIYYLSADLQRKEMFVPRKPLSRNARRTGWQGFYYDLSVLPPGAIVRLQ